MLLAATGCCWLLAAGQAVCAVQVREIPMRPHQLWRDDATLHWIALASVDIYLAAVLGLTRR